jgi:hypothetical protein
MPAIRGLTDATRLYDEYAAVLRLRGTVMLPRNIVFTGDEVCLLDAILTRIPEERIVDGDAGDSHDIYVRRIVTDWPGCMPEKVNEPYSSQILDMLGDGARREIFAALLPSSGNYHIRRCQAHRLVEGSFVGMHLDAASNPDYEFSVIVQLSGHFEGGDFVVYPDGEHEEIYMPRCGMVLVTTCKYRHEVRKVTANERRSLVYFYSRSAGVNSRTRPTSEESAATEERPVVSAVDGETEGCA